MRSGKCPHDPIELLFLSLQNMRKRILKSKRINLDLIYPIASANPSNTDLDSQRDYYDELYNGEYEDDIYDDYDPEEEYRNPEHKRIIPDGEQAFFSAIKSGEDW